MEGFFSVPHFPYFQASCATEKSKLAQIRSQILSVIFKPEIVISTDFLVVNFYLNGFKNLGLMIIKSFLLSSAISPFPDNCTAFC